MRVPEVQAAGKQSAIFRVDIAGVLVVLNAWCGRISGGAPAVSRVSANTLHCTTGKCASTRRSGCGPLEKMRAAYVGRTLRTVCQFARVPQLYDAGIFLRVAGSCSAGPSIGSVREVSVRSLSEYASRPVLAHRRVCLCAPELVAAGRI